MKLETGQTKHGGNSAITRQEVGISASTLSGAEKLLVRKVSQFWMDEDKSCR